MPKSTTYIYICTYVHAYTETIRDGGYWCEKRGTVTGRCKYSSIVQEYADCQRHVCHKAVWIPVFDLIFWTCMIHHVMIVYNIYIYIFALLTTLWAASNYNIQNIFSNSLSLLLQWNHVILFSFAFSKVCIEYVYLYISKHWRRLLWKESRMRNALITVNASV